MSKFLLFLTLLTITAFTVNSVVLRLENLPEKCDFSKCVAPDPNKINVHLVPHTHDDVGWQKTVDQYFYGTRNDISKVGVQYILDSVVESLIMNKDRRFIYVETAFFWMWWKEQNEETRGIVQELVRSGQLEFINGGWSMNDEACTHYNSIIDQMSWGLRRLNDTFGKCGVPKVAWQLDPFGHSKEQAALFAAMNFDALFFAREHNQEQIARRANKTLEHVWQGSEDLGTGGDLLTGMMDFGYGPPKGFNWDLVRGSDEPVIDNKESEEYNVPRLVEKLVNLAREYQNSYATNNVMFPMGTDFNFQAAAPYFKNMDKLITHVNEVSKDVKLFYSTPSCYAKALCDSGHTFTSKTDDYFPYEWNGSPHVYWTGYFVSRPALKKYERVGNNILQACKQIDVLAGNGGKYEKEITQMREIMGVMQHHDAITGTEFQHVANNYAKHLYAGIEACRSVISQSYAKLQSKSTTPTAQKEDFCEFLNISSCAVSESGKPFAINLYNPLGHAVVNKVIRVPVDNSLAERFYQVVDPDGNTVASEILEIPQYVQQIPGRPTKATTELVFQASIPALGLATYFVQVTTTRATNSADLLKSAKITKETKIHAANMDVVFDAAGAISSVVLKSGQVVPFTSQFRYYRGASSKPHPSGAYIFRPAEQETFSVAKLRESNLFVRETATGSFYEVHQKFDSYIDQVIRFSPDSDNIEFDWVVGPINVDDGIGKEIVTSYETNLKNERVFYTDANGRQMVRRQWDTQQSFKLNVIEPISGNYYPINSRIYLRDEKQGLQFTVLNDRSQGGTSPKDGVLELMVHRRLLNDDSFGAHEALNETGPDGRGLVIRGRHLVQIASIKEASSKHREAAQRLFMEPIISFVPEATYETFQTTHKTRVSGLAGTLLQNVHLLTLEQWNNGRYLIRLEHFYQKGEDADLSKPATVSLKKLFSNFEITSAQELTLGANQDISSTKNRLKFKYTPIGTVVEPPEAKFNADTLEVTLNPMQIRTFVVQVKRN